MKILFFINGLHQGGKERRMLELMKELKWRKEMEFELVLMNNEISYPIVFELNIKIYYLIRKSRKDPSVFYKFYKICKKFQPDIIHCWDSMTAIYAIPACKLLKIKLLNGLVVDTPLKSNIFNKRWLRAKITFPFSDAIVGNSNAGLEAYNAPVDKRFCIYNGMDLNRFINLKDPKKVRKEIFGECSDEIFVIGMVAAFEIRKDYKTLIEAAKALIEKNCRFRFVLVGGGTLLNQIKNMVPSPLLDKIIFLGKRSDVESIINIFDIGVLLTNSKVHGEGISNSIIEYMALGKPVIATKGGGTVEVIMENKNGYLIDAENSSQLIEKIETLYNENNPLRLGENEIQLVQKKFDLESMTQKYMDLYQNLIKDKKQK